jgi:phage baseplate assembly protein W
MTAPAIVTSTDVNAYWPGLGAEHAFISPPRNGMDRSTGKLLQGWEHVEQSMEVIYATPFHQRVLRRWVGSFVPSILGDNIVQRVIMRFFWALASALDMWEPDYRIKQVYFMGNSLEGYSPQTMDVTGLIRLGHVFFRQEGVYYPRGHLGDFTPFERRQAGLIGRGGNMFDVTTSA